MSLRLAWTTFVLNSVSKQNKLLGLVAHACSPSYLEVEPGKITIQGLLRQKVSETPSQTTSQVGGASL
jgi:hypothetical protein